MIKKGRGGLLHRLWLGAGWCLFTAGFVQADNAPTVLDAVSADAKGEELTDVRVFRYTNKHGVRSYSDVPPSGVQYSVMKFDCFACNPTSTLNWRKIPLQLKVYQQAINHASKQYRIDPALVRAVIHAESAFQAQAVSSKGAMGLMQLMPGTARDMGVADAMAPEQNILGGVKYLAMMLDEHRGNTRLATAAYNAGPGAVKRYGGVPPFKETQTYVRRVKLLHDRYREAMGKRFSGRVISGVDS
ncbi:MAG: lytic transglycosylase domain-containing protein [Halioglobus sp.]|nr:lytic transglycosylase domain-containing protein [Halioglobus sp.]